MPCVALLFDTLDSVTCHDGPLPLNLIHRCVPHVASAVSAWAPKSPPTGDARQTDEYFVLKGLLRRGYFDDQLTAKSPFVEATLACRCVNLFRALCERGLRWSPSELESYFSEGDESEVFLLIKEYEARRYSQRATSAYRISRKQHIMYEALDAKKLLKKYTNELRKRHLRPLMM
ncbi:hypothetical protein STCU_09786 [Strigomonas culicis]|uniref:Uncharacterized protein n=1 Tax=Strigomonas culicis TaxID=28005 RepID=S9TQ35_9TRYP|nr:hypothetical protein STCU_09786 [Strigomonas culicis]|eukprot:EPY18764.1 hypothetical protein STCU_09786 [Strigomonas culicis]